MKRWRVDDSKEIAFAEPNGDWVQYKDVLKEVRKFIDKFGGMDEWGNLITDKDIKNHFNRRV